MHVCTGVHVTAIRAEPELQPHDRLILVKAATKELARGRELWGAAMGEGVAVLGLGQQLVQSGPAKQPRCLLPQEEGDCGEGTEPAASRLALSDEKVPGIFSTLPPPQARPERGRRAQKSRRDLKITITFKGSCRASNTCPKKTSIPLKKKSILPQNHFVKIGSNGLPTPTDRSHGTH